MAAYSKAMDIIAKIVMQISIACFMAMMFCGMAQVVTRYVLNTSLDWTEEVARFMFIATTLFGSALCIRTNGHIAVDLFVSRLSARMQRQLAAVVLLADAALFLVMVKYGVEISLVTIDQEAPATEISMGLVYALVPVGGALMLLFVAEQALILLRGAAPVAGGKLS